MLKEFTSVAGEDGSVNEVNFRNDLSTISLGKAEGYYENVFFGLFKNVNIPQNAIIKDAFFRFYHNGYSTIGNVNNTYLNIFADKQVNSALISDWVDFLSRNSSENSSQIVLEYAENGWYEYNITKIIEEIVNQEFWEYGNNIQLFMQDNGYSENFIRIFTANYEEYAPKLIITYTEEENSIIARAKQIDDDGRVSGTTLTNTWNSISIGKAEGFIDSHGFCRFRNIEIEKNKKIEKAYIIARVDNYYFGITKYNDLSIYFVKETNPLQISSRSDFDSRQLTVNKINSWILEDEIVNSYVQTPELKNIIQELVNQESWAYGNDMMVFFIESGNSNDFIRFTSNVLSESMGITLFVEYSNVNYVYISDTIDIELNINFPFFKLLITVSDIVLSLKNIDVARGNLVKNIDVGLMLNPAIIKNVAYLVDIEIESNLPEVKQGYFIPATDIILEFFDLNYAKNKENPPVYTEKKLPDYNYFVESRIERFEYELLKFSNNSYVHDSFLAVKEATIDFDLSRRIIGTAKIVIEKNNNINFHTDLVRPYYILNDELKYPLGTYFLTIPQNSNGLTSYIESSVDCFDMLIVLEQDKLEYSYTAEKGENVINLVEDLIATTADWLKYQLELSDAILTENLIYEVGRSKLFVANSLLNMINYYPLFSDGYGTIRAKKWTPNYNINWEFTDDLYGLYMHEFTHTQDYSDIYNKAVVVVNSTEENTPALISVKTLEDVNLEYLPFSFTNINRYITKIFDSEAIAQEYIDVRVLRELKKMAELQETINYRHAFVSKRNDGVVYPGDCYKFKNQLNDLNSDYLIDKIQWNLKAGNMINTQLRGIINNV